MQVKWYSVADCADLTRCLRQQPVLVVYDDACTLSKYMVNVSKECKKVLGGERLGCFQVPSNTEAPTAGLNIPSLVPAVKWEGNPTDNEDCYIMGHRLNDREVGKRVKRKNGEEINKNNGKVHNISHIRKRCRYHNLDLCDQGKRMPSMLQEAVQNYRKKHRIDFDTAATMESTYVYNFVGDYFYNKKKCAEMEKQYSQKKQDVL